MEKKIFIVLFFFKVKERTEVVWRLPALLSVSSGMRCELSLGHI